MMGRGVGILRLRGSKPALRNDGEIGFSFERLQIDLH
jgi:hypothetical protein